MSKKAHMTGKQLASLILLLVLPGLPAAAFDLDADLSFTVTLKPGKVEFDLSFSLDLEGAGLDLDTDWKADESGFSSLKLVGTHGFPQEVDGKAEILFDDTRLKTLKLKLDGLPLRFAPGGGAADDSPARIDLETYFKNRNGLFLYQLKLGLDPPDILCVSTAADLALRKAYARCTVDLEHDPWEISLEETWKAGALSARAARVTYAGAGFELEEALALDAWPVALRPGAGTLTLDCDPTDVLTVKLACDHTFCAAGIVLDRLTGSVALDPEPFSLSWKGRFAPARFGLDLIAFDLSVSAEAETDHLSLVPKLKLDETGFRSLSIRVSISFSAG